MEEIVITENKKVVEYTMGMLEVNLIGMAMIVPISGVILLPFLLIWDYESLMLGKDVLMAHFTFYFFTGIIVHELLHGLTWAIFASNGLKSIRFGVKWKFLTPYCHCKEPLKVKHYKLGGAMPLIVMGIIPSIIGIISGNGGFLGFGIFFTWAAGGDIIALYMLRKLDNDMYVSDHPEKMGFIREIE